MTARESVRRLVRSAAVQWAMPGITPLCRYVCLRFDDYHPANDLSTWRQMLTAYNDRGLRGLVAVCPRFGEDPLRASDVGFLHDLREDGCEIAQHGYTHEDIAETDVRSEFQDVDFEEQRRRIGAGKDVLEDYGFTPRTFVPPWHRYDDATLRALAENGFDCINEGRWFLPR